MAGISAGYLSHLERGVRVPQPRTVRRLAGALDIDPRLLLLAADILELRLEMPKAASDTGDEKEFRVLASATEVRLLEVFWSFLQYTNLGRELVHGLQVTGTPKRSRTN